MNEKQSLTGLRTATNPRGRVQTVMVLCYPLAFLGLSPRWEFWSYGHSGAGLGECGALLPVCYDWQLCWVGVQALGWEVWGRELPCKGKARPALSCTHTPPKMSQEINLSGLSHWWTRNFQATKYNTVFYFFLSFTVYHYSITINALSMAISTFIY